MTLVDLYNLHSMTIHIMLNSILSVDKNNLIVVTSVPMLDMIFVNLISTYKVVLSVNSLTRKKKL